MNFGSSVRTNSENNAVSTANRGNYNTFTTPTSMVTEHNNSSGTTQQNDESILIPSQGSAISFSSLNYVVNSKTCCPACPLPCVKTQTKQILFDINGVFKPGMNAILGPTGSGKSSLLDILADRKDRRGLSGQVLMNGQNQSDDFKYRVGYVVQDDIVCGQLTVRENLAFSANLRLSKYTTREQIDHIVQQVIEQLGLEKCAETKVGTEYTRGVSGGERKRTNIGMELVLSPSVLFLDEPTTGLDSSTARNVMEYLHQLSRRGRTIIFSIHQPRYSIFKLFDTLFLVSSGYCIYHGPANYVLTYFSQLGLTCEEHDNPADFLLDITQGDRGLENFDNIQPEKRHEQSARQLNSSYLKSDIYARIQQEITAANNEKIVTINDNVTKNSKSRLREILYVSQRTLRNVYRNPTLVAMQTFVTTFFAILVGLIYLKVDTTCDAGIANRRGAIFFIVTNQVMSNLSAIELFLKERVLFIHENASGYYHVSTYFLAKLICDLIPLRLIPSVLFSTIVYFMIGFQQTVEKFFIFYFGIFCTTICGAAICFFFSASVQVFGIANLLTAMSFVLMMVFGGFLVKLSSVVDVLSWIKWVSLFRYSINIITINEFNGLNFTMTENGPPNASKVICPDMQGLDIIHQSNIDYETDWDLWKNFVALGSMILIFFTLAYVQLLRMKKTK